MTARDYRVTFGYGAKDGYYYGPNGIVGPYHRGNDRPCPNGTPIVIGTTTIGKTGNTGLSGGPHLHTQAGTDKACQNTIDPTPYDFKPGTVVATGWGNAWGNYITIQVGTRYITYAHLSHISVRTGQKVGGTMRPSKKAVQLAYQLDGRSASSAAQILHSTKGTVESLLQGLINDSPKVGDKKKIDGLNAKVKSLNSQVTALNNKNKELSGEVAGLKNKVANLEDLIKSLKNKPPEVIEKEIEKIVEKEVERFPSWIPGWIKSILEVVFKGDKNE